MSVDERLSAALTAFHVELALRFPWINHRGHLGSDYLCLCPSTVVVVDGGYVARISI